MQVRENDQWVEQNFIPCQLGDKRRTKRLVKIATNMLAAPDQSLPQQNAEWSDVKAAYRFFSNDNSTFDKTADPRVTTPPECFYGSRPKSKAPRSDF